MYTVPVYQNLLMPLQQNKHMYTTMLHLNMQYKIQYTLKQIIIL